jgi:hypothetical protein
MAIPFLWSVLGLTGSSMEGIDPILASFQLCYRSRHVHFWLPEIPIAFNTPARRASLRRFHPSSDITPSVVGPRPLSPQGGRGPLPAA